MFAAKIDGINYRNKLLFIKMNKNLAIHPKVSNYFTIPPPKPVAKYLVQRLFLGDHVNNHHYSLCQLQLLSCIINYRH